MLSKNNDVTIIADIGINHNSDINKLKRSIDIAVECVCEEDS